MSIACMDKIRKTYIADQTLVQISSVCYCKFKLLSKMTLEKIYKFDDGEITQSSRRVLNSYFGLLFLICLIIV